MPLDPSIILQDISPKFEDPQNMLAKRLQIQGLQQQQQENAFKMQQDRDAYQQQNALAQLLGRQGFNARTPEGQAELYRTGGVKNADAYLKNSADAGFKQAETSQKVTENQIKKVGMFRDALYEVNNPQDMARWITAQYNDPDLRGYMESKGGSLQDALARIPQDEATFRSLIPKAALGMSKYIEQNKPQFFTRNMGDRTDTIGVEGLTGQTTTLNTARNGQSPDSVASNARMAADNAASRGVTMRGQNMTDARSRESNSASMSKPFEVTGEDGKPVLVRQDKQGNISRVEGFGPKSGAEKPMTDAQSKAALFGSRMEESDKIIQDLAKSGTTKSIPFSNSGFGVGNAVTALSSGSQQQLQQAKRDFINATLRRESGAVISPSEFDNAEKQYFPQIGDEPSVIKQKANNRAIATRGVQAEIPKGQRNVVKEIIGNKAVNIDSLLEKYK